MVTTLAELAQFLLDHAPLIEDLYHALTMGVQEADLKKAIQDAKLAASDAEMKATLGLPQA